MFIFLHLYIFVYIYMYLFLVLDSAPMVFVVANFKSSKLIYIGVFGFGMMFEVGTMGVCDDECQV